MDDKIVKKNLTVDRFQSVLEIFTKCKSEYYATKNECQRIQATNLKLETELKESRDLEKSHRYHLQNSREMISNLQETISQLVYLKRGAKLLREEILSKDNALALAEKDNDNVTKKHELSLSELRNNYEKQMEEMKNNNERKIRQVQQDTETQIAQYSCMIEELKNKLIEVETEHRDKMNMVVLEYEEKIQRSNAQVVQLQDEISRQSARTDANIDAYRRKLDDLEEKLKQCRFKEYLAQSSYTQRQGGLVERPYSATSAYDNYSVDLNPVLDSPKPPKCAFNHRTSKVPGTLQITYSDHKSATAVSNDKKGQFNITKKRKLYTEKDFQDF